MRTALIALLLATLAVPATAAEWIGTVSSADREAVERAAVEADAHWNARDAGSLAQMYADDATLVVGNGPLVDGRDAVLRYFTASFARTPATLHHATQVDRVVVLAPDLVLADTRVALDDVADGTTRRVRDFSTLTVLRKRDGRWQLYTVRANPLPAPAAR